MSGVGVMDILMYSTTPDVSALLQQDLIAFGQLLVVYGLLSLIKLVDQPRRNHLIQYKKHILKRPKI